MIPYDRMTGSDFSSVIINKIFLFHNHDSENPPQSLYKENPHLGGTVSVVHSSKAHLKTRAICEDSPPSIGKLVMMGSTTSVKSWEVIHSVVIHDGNVV